MKKRFKLVDLDCANCAAKMEDAIKKVVFRIIVNSSIIGILYHTKKTESY